MVILCQEFQLAVMHVHVVVTVHCRHPTWYAHKKSANFFVCTCSYMCDPLCYDFNNGHLCKHIHRVHSMDRQRSSEMSSVYCHDSIVDNFDQNSE